MEARAQAIHAATMRIGALARDSGYTDKTLRYYEELGLLRPAGRTASGYRTYATDAVERLRLIRNAQDLGLSLRDVRTILDAGDAGDDPCVHTLALVDRQLRRLAEQARRLRELRRDLTALRRRVSEGAGMTLPGGGLCSCLTEEIQYGKRSAVRARRRRRNVRKEDADGLPLS